MANSIYFDDSGKPRLLPSYCVFADFLGFRHEITEAVKRGEEEVVFRRFMDDIEPKIEDVISSQLEDEDDDFPRMWDAKVFTDNVVLGYGRWSGRGESEFGHAISQLLEFQYAVALKGYFVRGGWAVGNLFMNRNTVFGGSLLEAYDLEQNQAVYPRILLSEGMKDLVFQHMARYGCKPPQCYHLLVDESGRLFTNYLIESIVDGDVMWDGLKRHAGLIGQRLKEHEGNQRVFLKYQWLAAYHNFFCNLVSNDEGYSESVRVSGTFPEFGIRELRHEESPYAVEVQAEIARREKWLESLKTKNRD